MLKSSNQTFPVTALKNETWITEQLRPIREDEIVLKQFSVFSAENEGKENFSTTCLKPGNFLLNGVETHCKMGDIKLLPETTWKINNKHGQFQHYEFRHYLKNQTRNQSGWEELSDVIVVPQFTKPNVTQTEPEIEDNYFVFLDEEGRFTNHSHITFYSGITVFIITAILLCIFRRQIKNLCNCCCKPKAFVPKIDYNVRDEEVTIVDREQKKKKPVKVNKEITVTDVFANHEYEAEIGPPAKLALKTGQTTTKVKKSQPAADQPIPAQSCTTQATTAVTHLTLGDWLTVANSEDIGEINQEYLTSLLAAAKGGSK